MICVSKTKKMLLGALSKPLISKLLTDAAPASVALLPLPAEGIKAIGRGLQASKALREASMSGMVGMGSQRKERWHDLGS